ncbi:uncharacterized protein [Tenebrio molitor]|uniref:uncharacterized protein isoform X2 n=1 Tax=Tenebrio molitor TaxID=7067 RepID=UPI0036248BE3
MMNPIRMNYDCLKPVRMIGSSIYQFKFVKYLLKLTLITHSTMLLLQLYYFLQAPNMEDLIKYGLLFLQLCYTSFAFAVLLVKNHMVENVMNVIELWDISSARNDVKLRIARESKQINIFVVINTSLILLWATQIMSSPDDTERIFVQHVLDKLCPRQTNFYVVIFKVTLYLAGLALQVHAYQVIYTTQHVKFQMYMLNALIEGLGSDVEGSESLIRDEIYQEEVESKLEKIIDRHCELIRSKNNALMLMSNLIIPFTTGAIVIGISIVLSFVQEVILWRSFVVAVSSLSTILSIIAAGQSIEDESENMLLKLEATNWYNWNTRNRKKLVLTLMNAANPIQLKFSEGFIVNFKLLMFIFKALYSVLPILVEVAYNRI